MADAAAPSQPVDDGRWDFLQDTYWYVPPAYLPAAVVIHGDDPQVVTVADQTVWRFDTVVDGYVVGEARTNLGGGWQYSSFVGSITPDGQVTISFTLDEGGAVTVGRGQMVMVDGRWQFEMQMDTGDDAVSVSHWAFMDQVRPSDAAWDALPGFPDSSVDRLFDADGANDGGQLPTRTLIGTTGADQLVGAPVLDLFLGQAGDDQLAGMGGDDLLLGGSGADSLDGGIGHDLLDGGLGADLLSGGAGDDTLEGGEGQDTLLGGLGRDTASFSQNDAGVRAHLADALVGGDVVTGVENLKGSNFADDLAGDDAANGLSGGDGDDLLAGGAGDDTLAGGLGRDTASYAGAAAGVSVNLALAGPQDTLGDGVDRLRSIENLVGSAFDDALTGDGRKNVLIGGSGQDTMAGGGGSDVFRFLALSDSSADAARADLILDLEADDRIDLRAIDADAFKAGNQAFVLVGALDGHVRQAALSYDAGADRTLLQLDVNGDGQADMTVAMAGDRTSFTNFVL